MSTTRVVITGPTASGKGKVAAAVARRLRGEVVSVDSMKVYRGMDIGTAKPSLRGRAETAYHMLDLLDPWEEFSVGEFIRRVLRCVDEIEGRGRRVILQGGTAFYLHALLHGLFHGPSASRTLRRQLEREAEVRGLDALHAELLEQDPVVGEKIHPRDRRRVIRAVEVIRQTGERMSDLWRKPSPRLDPATCRCYGILWPRADLYARIDRRVEDMVERGLFEEAERLLLSSRGLSRTASKCIGYRQIIEGRERGASRDEVLRLIQRDTRRFAKQQLTWFRRFPIRWLDPDEPGVLAARIERDLESESAGE